MRFELGTQTPWNDLVFLLFFLFCRYFGQPLIILMSPQDVPTAFQGDLLFIYVNMATRSVFNLLIAVFRLQTFSTTVLCSLYFYIHRLRLCAMYVMLATFLSIIGNDARVILINLSPKHLD